MDFLGLRNLTIIGDALQNISANRGIELDLDDVPLDDPATFELLGRGDTLGVFQLDGGPMRDLLRRMQPTGFEDVVAVIALYRPGPMGVNAHNDYADRKNARQAIKPIHPELEEPLREILSETYGLIVYQEQIMRIAQKVAGYSLARADILRKAMGKKKREVLDKEYEGFSEGMKSNGFSAAAVKALWDTVLPFADYAFNKSHAAGYGLVSYWTAYLKANFPAEYMAGLLTSVGDDKDKAAVYLADCRRLGITVLPPDVNESELNFASVGVDIRFGLGAVRNVGANVVGSLINTRSAKGKYTDFSDYLNKIDVTACNKKVTESLIKAGAFDSLDHSRKGLFLIHTDAVDSVLGTKKAEAMGQFDLFGGADTATDAVFAIRVPEDEWEDKHKLALEREMLGLYVSGHPLNGVAHLPGGAGRHPNPGDPRRRRAQRGAGPGRRHPGVREPAGEQERNALGLSAIGGSHRWHRGDVLPAHVLDVRSGHRRRHGGDHQRKGELARRSAVTDRERPRGARLLERSGGSARGRESADPPVHRREGGRAQAGTRQPSRHVAGAVEADQRRPHHHARTGSGAAGDAVLGIDG